MSKAEKRAQKKERHRVANPHCEQCGRAAPRGGEHDSVFSKGVTTWDGIVIVAWCQFCGWEFCS